MRGKGFVCAPTLQVPNYVVLTIGEIMFSVTGLEFAYRLSYQPCCRAVFWVLCVLGVRKATHGVWPSGPPAGTRRRRRR